MKKYSNSGFTLIELLVVIAIIGIISTLAVVALSSSRMKSRDAKRIADMKQVATALELYYSDQGFYPTDITPGSPIKSPDEVTTYMAKVPNNPTPHTDQYCSDDNYIYSISTYNDFYHIYFCTGGSVDQFPEGGKFISPNGFSVTAAPNRCGGFFDGTCGAADPGLNCCETVAHCYGNERACTAATCGALAPATGCVALGDPCTNSEECETGLCEGGACVTHADKFSCIADANCSSDHCLKGVCRPGL